MKMLIVSSPELYEAGRFQAEGSRLGHRVDVVPFEKLSFIVRPRRTTVLIDGRDLFRSYDTLYLRHFYPYISEALHLAEWARKRGLRVIDRRLAEKNFVQSKMYNYWKLAGAGIPVPPGFQVMDLRTARRLLDRRRWPVVAKGIHGSRGRYVFRLDSPRQAERELTQDMVGFFTFQDYLKIAAEYRVMTIGFKAIGAMRKIPPAGDFRHNIAVGAVGIAADLPPKMLRLCEKAARLLGHEMAGVDLAIVRGRPCILEANRTPGFESFEPVTGINVAEAFLRYAAKT
jgi:RimK family alpha-L-glutamate ligase